MAGEGLTIAPLRMTLTNVNTGESMTAQYNPEEIREKLVVNYNDLEIMGLSHKPKQYKNTSNLSIQFELGFDALSTSRSVGFDDAQNSDAGNFVQPVLRARPWLMSLCYSPKGAQDVVGGGPPDVIFSWPNMFSIVSRITELSFTHKRFDSKMQNVLFTCAISIDEARTVRLYSEDVLDKGTIRS